MTLETITREKCRLFEPSTSVDLSDLGEVPSLYSPVAPAIQRQVDPEATVEKGACQQTLERLLEKLSGKEFLGKAYAQQYLRDQNRDPHFSPHLLHLPSTPSRPSPYITS